MSYQAGLAIKRSWFMCGTTVAAEIKALGWASIAGGSNG